MGKWTQAFKEDGTMLYWAYGSNLNIRQMRVRCPRAKYLGPMCVQDAALVFRGVADVVVRKDSVAPGGLWLITKECEEALDRYEGYRPTQPRRGMYRKSYFKVRRNKQVKACLFYQMNSDSIYPPGEQYLRVIADGYRDFGLEEHFPRLQSALDESWKKPKKGPDVVARLERSTRQPNLIRDLLELDERECRPILEPKFRRSSRGQVRNLSDYMAGVR